MSEKFVSKFRFGRKPNLPGLGPRRLLFLKLTPMVHRKTRTYRAWGSKIGRKNRELNSPVLFMVCKYWE